IIPTAAALVLVAVIAQYARVDVEWPAQVPIAALLVGVAVLFIVFQLATTVVSALAPRLRPEEVNPLYTILIAGAALALLWAGLVVIARGHVQQRGDMRAAGLFLAMMGLLFVALNVPQVANVFGLPVVPESRLSVPALKFVVL